MKHDAVSTPSGNIRFGPGARRRLAQGARATDRVVGATLGPSGRNVIFERAVEGVTWAAPISTRDGVTVARELQFEDRHVHMGAMMALEAARRTVIAAGDGTTATVVLAGELVARGQKLCAAGVDPMAMARGMRSVCAALVRHIQAMARPVDESEEVGKVALIAANGDTEIASAIVEAIEAVGTRGVVTIERSSRSDGVVLDMASGLWFDRGWSTASLLNADERQSGRVELVRPLVLVLDDVVAHAQCIVSLLEAALRTQKGTSGRQANSPSGLLIVGDVERDALSTLVQNRHNGQLNAVSVRPPWGYGGIGGGGTTKLEILEDIALATGAKVLGVRTGRSALLEMSEAAVRVGLESLGVCDLVTVTERRTLMELSSVGLAGEDLEEAVLHRLDHIEAMRQRAAQSGQMHTSDSLANRASRLGGGAATLKVGGLTETEANERAFRVEDALCAARTAILDGVVPGAGATLVFAAERARKDILTCQDSVLPTGQSCDQDELAGMNLVLDSCKAPFVRLVNNTGANGVSLARKLIVLGADGEGGSLASSTTWDARSSRFVDAWSAGIMDPVRVPICVSRNAVSAAASLLEVEVSLHPLRDRDAG